MGYNIFTIKKVPAALNRKLNEFRDSLGDAINDGKNNSFADRDISYMLSLQHERISSKGLELDYDIYQRDKQDNTFNAASNWRDAHYESTVCYNPCGMKRVVKKDGKIRYKDDEKRVAYETITDVVNGAHPDNDPYCCPSCGGVSTVAGLKDGCSYCGTKFQMDELFPKISSYYFLEDASMSTKELKSIYFKVYIVTLFILYFIACITDGDKFLPENLLSNPIYLIGALIGFPLSNMILAYFATGYLMIHVAIFKLIASAGKIGTTGSRRKFEMRMRRVSPEFSYEYFTSKAISLIKTAIFAQDEQELMFYDGNALNPKMKDIIDLNYGGALGIRRFIDEGNFITVITNAYFDVLYADDEKVYHRSQVFRAIFKRRTDIPVKFNFSMTRISCPSCGASFDATRVKTCPYCDNKYDIITDDWILTELKYNNE